MLKRTIATIAMCLAISGPTQATQTQNQLMVESAVYKPVPVNNRQLLCLARNIYHEAGNQSDQGMVAVANVVYNRMNDKRWPDTPCDVIYQRHRGTCQFSWVCSRDQRIRYAGQYERALVVARQAMNGELRDITGGAKFYHADYVNPGWRYRRTTKIGDHIFYRG